MELTDFCAQSLKILAQQPSVILFKSKSYSPLSFDRILKWLYPSIHSSLQMMNTQGERRKIKVVSLETDSSEFDATNNTAVRPECFAKQKVSKDECDQNLLKKSRPISKLDMDQDLSELTMKLHTTFLGQSSTFWFGDLSLISSKKKRSDWLTFLQTYQGPHQIIGWLSEDDSFTGGQATVIVLVPELLTRDIVHKISFLYQEHKPETSAYFFGRLYRTKKEYKLEQLCLLQSYAGLIGKNMDLFFEDWLEQLIISDVSLFYLGQLFFEKQADQFFAQWHQVRGYYSDQFWTVFFSEQLFKAYFYVAAQGRVAPDKKQMTYGLPFSFLKNDWRLYQPAQLQQAHQQLYEIDVALKTGGTMHRLDLFFAKFFAG